MFKALIVDDEPAARAELRYLLESIAKIKVVGEATTAEEAYELLTNIEYDVVFLDVRMPGLSGTELARKIYELPKKPAIVFVSAYSEHAIEAFEVEADDYLVKPVSEERILKTVEKLERKRLKEQIPETGVKQLTEYIFVDVKEKKIPIKIDDIYYFEALDDYSRLYTKDSSFLINYTLRNLEEKLGPRGFIRVHRKYIVNPTKIKEVIQLSRNSYILRLDDEKNSEIPVSRRKIPYFKRVFEL